MGHAGPTVVSNVHFSIYMDGELFVVRWREPTVDAFGELEAIIRARSQELGRKLYYVAVVPEGSERPEDELRDVMMDGVGRIWPDIETLRMVILGSGFQVTLVRSAMAAMTLVVGLRGYSVRVEKSLLGAIEPYAERTGRSASALLEALGRSGLAPPAEFGA